MKNQLLMHYYLVYIVLYSNAIWINIISRFREINYSVALIFRAVVCVCAHGVAVWRHRHQIGPGKHGRPSSPEPRNHGHQLPPDRSSRWVTGRQATVNSLQVAVDNCKAAVNSGQQLSTVVIQLFTAFQPRSIAVNQP